MKTKVVPYSDDSELNLFSSTLNKSVFKGKDVSYRKLSVIEEEELINVIVNNVLNNLKDTFKFLEISSKKALIKVVVKW